MADRRPVYVFDHVRSNSQLFNKLFLAHPQLENIFMPMIGASLYGPEAIFHGRQHSNTTDQTFASLAAVSGAAETETYQVAIERLEGAVDAILQKGKIPWVKDHAFCVVPRDVQDAWTARAPLPEAPRSNPTVFRAEFLDNVRPVFLIRHPALSIPSFLRKDITICKNQAGDEDFAIYTALYWSRLLFDWYVQRSGEPGSSKRMHGPIVVNAADVIYKTEAAVEKLCQRLEIEQSGVQLSWAPVPTEEQPGDPVMRSFFDALYRSSGVEKRASKPSEVDLDVDELQKGWSEEFGAEAGCTLRKLVDRELEHYDYLLKFKLEV